MRNRLTTLVAALVCACVGADVAAADGAVPPPKDHLGVQPQPVEVADAPGYAETGGESPGLTGGGIPALASPIGGSGPSIQMEPAGDEFVCSPGWHFIAAKANSFVTGNCIGGWKMLRTQREWDSVNEWWWDGGYINGPTYDGCGWMRQQDSTYYSSRDGSGCADPRREYCEYIYCDNGTPRIYGSKTDGEPVTVTQSCPQYANYRPWSSSATPANYQRTANPGATLLLRYFAKYPSGGWWWYMVRDPAVPKDAGEANWVFVPIYCF